MNKLILNEQATTVIGFTSPKFKNTHCHEGRSRRLTPLSTLYVRNLCVAESADNLPWVQKNTIKTGLSGLSRRKFV